VKYHLQPLAMFYCPFLDLLQLFSSLQRSTDLSLAYKLLRARLFSAAGALLLLLGTAKGGDAPPDHSIPAIPPHTSPSCALH